MAEKHEITSGMLAGVYGAKRSVVNRLMFEL